MVISWNRSGTRKPSMEYDGYTTLRCSHIAIGHGPFIVDLPMESGDFPSPFVCLPEVIQTGTESEWKIMDLWR